MQIDTKNAARRGRGRPRAYDPKAALGAALDAFWSAGYSATSLDALAAATGMNRPSLYAAFGNKQQLYLQTLQMLSEDLQRQVSDALRAPGPLAESLRRFYLHALTLYLSGEAGPRGCPVVCTATVEASTDAAIRGALNATLRFLDDALIERFQRAIADGELGPDVDADTRGRMAAATLHSMAIRSRAGQSRASLRRLVDGAIATLCAPT